MQEFFLTCCLVLAFLLRVQGVPVNTSEADISATDVVTTVANNVTKLDETMTTASSAVLGETDFAPEPESIDTLVPAGSRENTGVLVPDGVGAGSYDPTEAFQQYYNKFHAAYAPFYSAIQAPFPAAYPAPPGYGPALSYPAVGPYVVQTDYDGYLVPSANIDTSVSPTSDPIKYLRNLATSLMATTVFRALAAIATVVGMIFFGGAITTAICSFTPICDISFRAVSYLRRHDSAERVAKTIVEEIASERVRRATEFVWKAIRKYRDMQQTEEKEQ